MSDYSGEAIKFSPAAIDLNLAADSLPDGKFSFIYNFRTIGGKLQPRNKFRQIRGAVGVGTDFVWKTKRLLYGSTNLRLIHSGGKFYVHNLTTDALTLLDSGFLDLANSTSIVRIKPEESSEPWLYISNSNRFKKYSLSGDYNDVGISPSNSSASVKIAQPIEKIIDELGSTVGSYTNVGAAGAPVAVVRIPNTTTLLKLLFDSGSSGWASIVVNTFPSGLQDQTIITLNDATIPVSETVKVRQVIPAYIKTGVATIQSIKYDSGVNGDCTIHLSIPPEDIIDNAILLLGGTEYIRVKSVIGGTQGNIAIRTSTIGTFAAAATVSGVASFRTYLANGTYTLVNTTISTDAMKIPFAASGVGYAQRLFNVDLSLIGTRPVSDEDVIYCAILLSDTSKLDEAQIQIGLDATPGDFRNYLYYPISPSSLTQSYKQTGITPLAQQQAIQMLELQQRIQDSIVRDNRRGVIYQVGEEYRGVFDYETNQYYSSGSFPDATPIPNETNLGDFQWSVFAIPIKELQKFRVGTDTSRTLKDVTGVRFSFKVNGAVDCYVDSFSIGGTYALNSTLDNTTANLPYFYVYRYRSTKTRAVSNWSPANRNGLRVSRDRIELTFVASSDSQVDKIDIARYGGRVNSFNYIGTKDNNTNPFYDEMPDDVAIANPTIQFDNYKPFAILDKSRKGTCNVIGTEVTRLSGDNFSVDWARGGQIIIDGVPNTLYNSPSTTSALTLEKSMGTLTSVSWYIPEPLLTGQKLPVIFGPFGEGNLGLIVFGLGNTDAPGTLYWLNGNSPDTMRDTNYLEITDPSEPLIDGIVFRGVPYVWSSKRIFEIRANISDNELVFAAIEIEGTKGLCNRGAITSAESVYFASFDGIYSFNGGQISLISTDISPLFSNLDANVEIPSIRMPFNKINISSAAIQLGIFQNKLYFYEGTNGIVWVYDIKSQSWISADFTNDINYHISSINVDEEYEDELIFGGLVSYFRYSSTSGAGAEAAFQAKAMTGLYDYKDSRLLKLFKEFVMDFDAPVNGIFTQHLYIDNFTNIRSYSSADWKDINPNADAFSSAVARRKKLIQLSEDLYINNFAFLIVYDNAGNNANDFGIYEIKPSILAKGELIINRPTDWTKAGFDGNKLLKEVVIEANTFGQAISIQVESDEGIIDTITLNHNGQKRTNFTLAQGYGDILRIKSLTANTKWILFEAFYVYEKAPDSDTTQTEITNAGVDGRKYLQRIEIDADTSNLPVLIDIYDGDKLKLVSNLEIQHDGRITKSYDFPPVKGFEFCVKAQSNCRIWEPIVYKFDLEPVEAKIWHAQPTTFDINGWKVIRKVLISLSSIAESLLTINIDGVDFEYPIASTGGEVRKVLISLLPVKGKLFEPILTCDSVLELYKKDCEFHVININGGETVIKNPFGNLHREIGTA